jgi:hypothetical protein
MVGVPDDINEFINSLEVRIPNLESQVLSAIDTKITYEHRILFQSLKYPSYCNDSHFCCLCRITKLL